jgi:vesicle coat complex subunit
VVRKKAVMALLRFFLLSPTSIEHLYEKVRRALCDADPSVMSATLNLLEHLVEVLCFLLVLAQHVAAQFRLTLALVVVVVITL